jgi:hypothetical protein
MAGCKKTPPLPGPTPQPVHGRVIYRGQPAQGFRVLFHPTTPWKGAQFAPSAMTDKNGEYQLRSYQSDDGAPAGEYTVTFQWLKTISTNDPADVQPEIDQLKGLFNDPKKSRFKAVVREGNNEIEPFVLK